MSSTIESHDSSYEMVLSLGDLQNICHNPDVFCALPVLPFVVVCSCSGLLEHQEVMYQPHKLQPLFRDGPFNVAASARAALSKKILQVLFASYL